MKASPRLLAKFGLFPAILLLSFNIAHSETDTSKTFLDKLIVQVEKLDKSCAKDIKKYCTM